MKLFSWTLLIIINLWAASAFGDQTDYIDSLRNEINKKSGADKISAQLDLALQLNESRNEVAHMLASEALKDAKASKNETLKMRAYLVIGLLNTSFHKVDESLLYFDSALVISDAIQDNWYRSEILLRKGSSYHRKGEPLKALELFNESLKACRLSQNYRIMGATYSMMGTIFRINGLYDRAIEYIVKSKLNYEKDGYTEGYAWDAYLLGRIYADLKHPQKALEYFREAVEIYKSTASIDGNKNGIAICLEQIGLLNIEAGNFMEARKNVEDVLNIYSEMKSEYGISNAKKNLGIIEYSTGDYKQAEVHLREALAAKVEIGDMLSQPGIYEYLGLSLIKLGQTDEGFASIYKGLELAKNNSQKKIESDIYSKLAEAYLEENNLKKALEYQSRQIEIQDLLLSGAANIKLDQLQAIYEIDAQNSQIAELERQNEVNSLRIKEQRTFEFIMIAAILIALLVALAIFWTYRKIRRTNNELKEANTAKDQLFAFISHDLRGPVSSLNMYLELINSRFDTFNPEELKEGLLELQKSSEATSELLENLLVWAQSQADKIEYNPRTLNLSEMLSSSVKGLKPIADKKQINIQLQHDEGIMVSADPDMLQAIARNIVSNAIKFTNRGGQITIRSWKKNGNTAQISIADNGVGIKKADISKIFDISIKHYTPGTEDEKSTGLGLILVKDFVEKNQGHLSIESEVGKGTDVSFTLPLAQQTE